MRLEKADVDEFRTRFGDFADGVVCEVALSTRRPPRTCRILIECQDRDAECGWSNVCFTVHEVDEFRFERGKVAFEVLSSGIQFAWQGNAVYVVLDAYPYDGPDLPV